MLLKLTNMIDGQDGTPALQLVTGIMVQKKQEHW